MICPECGAEWPKDQSCQGIFDEFLVLEFEDPQYGAVHFLTVATFMIQHGRYSDEAQAWMLQALKGYLEEGKTIDQVRQMARRTTGQANRSWKVMRPAGAPPPKRIAWEMTIVDVAREAHDAASYCALVTEWARGTVRRCVRR